MSVCGNYFPFIAGMDDKISHFSQLMPHPIVEARGGSALAQLTL
jgi:hypothetical protein